MNNNHALHYTENNNVHQQENMQINDPIYMSGDNRNISHQNIKGHPQNERNDFIRNQEQLYETSKIGDSCTYSMTPPTKTFDELNSNDFSTSNNGNQYNSQEKRCQEYASKQNKNVTKHLYSYSSPRNEQYNNSSKNNETTYMNNNNNNVSDCSNYPDYKVHANNTNKTLNSSFGNPINNFERTYENSNYQNSQESAKPTMCLYNKKKSTFNADYVEYPYIASPREKNNIYGNYENEEKSEVYRNNDNKEINNIFQQNETQSSKFQGESKIYNPINKSEKIKYLGESHLLKNPANVTSSLNNRDNSDAYHYMNTHSNDSTREEQSLYNANISDPHREANYIRAKNMNHTKIFDYSESHKFDEKDRFGHKKKVVDTFIPKYKNLTAREALYKHLSGNDSITVLAANSMEINADRFSDKDAKELPNVYPFNIADRVKAISENEEKKKYPSKLLPANYTHLSHYKSNRESDITLSQRRYEMTSSHIFDTENPNEEGSDFNTLDRDIERVNMVEKLNENNALEKQKGTMEIKEKRKNNPMYTDLFGRKTPDTDINIAQKEKILSTTMQNNWMYHASDVKKYAEPKDENKNSYEQLNCQKPDTFYRKSYFSKDGYDNTKRLQEALKKGSKFSLQAHLQSSFQNEKGVKYNLNDVNKAQTYYLTLYNLKDSISDEDIKKVVKSSEAHLVSYKPDYDLLSNVRKSTAKLCIRHKKGQEGLEHLQNLFSQIQIKLAEK